MRRVLDHWLNESIRLWPLAVPVGATLVVFAVLRVDMVLAAIVAALPFYLWLVLRYPFFVAACYFAVTSFRLPEGLNFPRGLTLVLGLMTLAAIGINLVTAHNRRPSFTTEQKLLMGFIAATIASVAFSTLPSKSMELWSEGLIKSIIAGFAIIAIGRSRDHVIMMAWISIAAGLLLAPVLIANKILKIGLVEGTRAVIAPGVDSILADPNYSALVMMLPLSLVICLLWAPVTRATKLFAFVASLVLLTAIIATQSRGGLFGVLAIGAVASRLNVRAKSLVALVPLVLVIVLYLLMGLGTRSSGFTADGLDASSEQRTFAWRAAINMALANPFGVGLGTFQNNFYFYTPQWVGRAMDVHSTWLQVLGECGFLALAFYVSAVVLALKSLLRSRQRLIQNRGDPVLAIFITGFIVGYVSYFVAASFISNAYSSFTFFLIFFAAIVENIVGRRIDVTSRMVSRGEQSRNPSPSGAGTCLQP